MSAYALEITAVLFFVALSALYSGSETALTAVGARGAQKLLDRDPRGHRRLRLWIEHRNKALVAILVGNNLANISATALMTDLSQRWLGESTGGRAVAVAIGVMTFLILTFGEITPKVLSNAFANRLALPAIRFVAISFVLFWPLTKAYVLVLRWAARVAGRELPTGNSVTEEEIEFLVHLGKREGSLTEDKQRLLHSVFDISETTVKEVMVPRVDLIALEENVTYEELIQTVVECGHSRLPVYRETIDQILGMFYAKDVLRHFAADESQEDFRLIDYIRDPVFVPTSKRLDTLLQEFQQRRIHIAVAVDEFGGTAGVVTLEDIIEEFFGEIQDEYDQEEPLVRKDDDGCLVADARVNLNELAVLVGFEFPDEHDYESLGGFISEKLGSVPEPGEEMDHEGFRFTVLESEPTHVVSVRIEELTGSNDVVEGEDDEPQTKERTPVSV